MLVIAMTAGMVVASEPDPVPLAIATNSQSLDRVDAYYLKIRHAMIESLDTLNAPVESDVREIWRSGDRYRFRERVYYVAHSEGYSRVDNPFGSVRESSTDGVQIRSLHGWDPEHPVELPLNWGRNAKEFSEVKGTISVADPTTSLDVGESASLLWRIGPGLTLEGIAEISQLVVVPTPQESIVQLRFESSDDPRMKEYLGMIIDVDLSHGGMIRRVERQWSPEALFITEVVQFEQTHDGIWLPIKLLTTMNGREFGNVEVLAYSINEPIAEADLSVEFPEGAKVHEMPEGKIHLWGKEGPAISFNNLESLMEHSYAQAREYQRQKSGAPSVSNQQELAWTLLMIINTVLIGLLIVPFFIRRRIGRSKPDHEQADI